MVKMMKAQIEDAPILLQIQKEAFIKYAKNMVILKVTLIIWIYIEWNLILNIGMGNIIKF